MFVCSFNGQALRTVLLTVFCRSLMLLSHIGMSSLNTCKLHSYLASLRQMIRARSEKGTCKIFLINTVCTRVMAAGFFPPRFGVKIGGAAITRRKRRNIFFRKYFRWCLPLLNYSTILYWFWVFLAIDIAYYLPAGINGDTPQTSDGSVSEAAAKSRRLGFYCFDAGYFNLDRRYYWVAWHCQQAVGVR